MNTAHSPEIAETVYRLDGRCAGRSARCRTCCAPSAPRPASR
ncbi:hypothetical protein ACFQ0M_09305 [Kitasatospora aburaviensis]